MDAQLSQSITWTGPAGAFYDVLVNPLGGGNPLKVHPAAQLTTVLLSTLLAGVDLVANPTVELHVRTKVDAAGTLPSGWSSPALVITIVGFGIPSAPTLVRAVEGRSRRTA